MTTPAEAIDVINARFGSHAGRRALHAKGTWCEGTFTATPAAAALSRAAHLRGEPIPALARVSNGGGNPKVPDYAPDVRGLAVTLTLPDGSATDMVAQSVPRFFQSTPQEFVEFIRAGTGVGAAVKLPLYLATHPKAVRRLPANAPALRPPPSYAQCAYFGVHAFVWVDADGGRRAVRWSWEPEAGDARIGPREAKSRGRDYLQDGVAPSLPARWRLQVTVAAPGDPTDDPSALWPDDRERVDAGVLELTAVVEDPETGGNVVVFDPTRLTDGIELSDDPFLPYRAAAYSESVARRVAGS
ncbi:MAG TPA: catalase family peroxidase [Solirubrobacteraceae bacterium]